MNCSVITMYENEIAPTDGAGTKPLSLLRCIKLMISYIFILLFMVIVFFLLLWLPFIGQLIAATLMGFCFGSVYLKITGSKYGLKFGQIASCARKFSALVMGYGIGMYILIIIPYAGGLMLPGILIGGAMIMRDYEMING